jgi:type I restriction enzyme, S subunit
MNRWPIARIGDIADVFDGPHATPEKITSGPIFLGISSLDSGRLNLAASEHLSEDDFTKWTRRVLPTAGDVVFSYETRLGQAALIPEGLRCCLGRRMGLVRPRTDRLDSRYFLYQYLGSDFQLLLQSRTIHGSTVDRIALKEFPDFPVSLPPLSEQRAIAYVLGTLDDKIELNRRMSQTLEAIAQAIFKSWCTDFDSVKARARDLIAEGVLAIGDGYRAKNDELGTEGMPFIRAADLNSGFDTERAERLRPDRVPTAKGKLSIVGDVAFTSKGTVGRFARVGEYTEPFVYSPQVCFWRSRRPDAIHPAVLYCWMQSEAFVSQLLGVAGQTDMAPYVSLGDQRAMEVPRFHSSQSEIGERIEPLLRLISEKHAENRSLANVRDALLPKLLSGELSERAQRLEVPRAA